MTRKYISLLLSITTSAILITGPSIPIHAAEVSTEQETTATFQTAGDGYLTNGKAITEENVLKLLRQVERDWPANTIWGTDKTPSTHKTRFQVRKVDGLCRATVSAIPMVAGRRVPAVQPPYGGL